MRVIKFLLVVCFIMSSFSYGADKLVFGINPYRSPDVLREMYRDYLEYLEKELNKEIVFVVSKDYAHLAELIENGTVDFASVSPKLLATMREKDKRAQYLATIQIKDIHHQITGTYNGLILARKDSGIRTLQDLKGKRFAFTDKDSTSGYFYPRILLKEAHVDVDKDFSIVYMLKKHPKVIQALLERSIDAGAVSGAAYEEALVGENKEKIHQNLQILATTEDIPYDAIVASPHLDKAMVRQIKALMMKFKAHESTVVGAAVGFEEKPIAVYDRLSTF